MEDKEINQSLIQNGRIYKELQKLGLSEKESLVYVASLQLGTSTIQKVATLSGVNRATTYVLIESLVKKGLMHSVTYGKKRFFTAEEPDKLDFFINEDKIALEKKEQLVKGLIPELDKIFDINKLENKTKVKFYDGERGAAIISNDIINTKNSPELHILYNYDLITPELNFNFNKDLAKKLEKKDIIVSGYFVSKKGDKIIKESNDLDKNNKSLPILINNKELTNDYNMFLASIGNKAIIVSLKGEFMGVIINSKPVSSAIKQFIKIIHDVDKTSR